MQRNTVQREQILNAVRMTCNHPTAEQIYSIVKQQNDKISLGTVYRNLNRLAQEGLIHRLEIPGECDRYDSITDKHYHICCTECGEFCDIDIPYRADIQAQAESVSSYKIDSHSIIFKGLCPKCQQKKK
ncbi:MAG: transcriptional repressor [Firmicutes bacterium]|nr:transcriptional repressor [Bacillota bacterium]